MPRRTPKNSGANMAANLFKACQEKNIHEVERLIAAGADVNKARTNDGSTPLFIASENGHLGILDRLIATGADVNKARTDFGATPLFIASQRGYLNVVDRLIAAGVDVNKATHNGSTPLYTASHYGKLEIVDRLIAVGADVNKATTINGITPLSIATENSRLNVVERLIAAGADVNKARNDFGATPLHIASENNRLNIVERLIAAGADVNKALTTGETPLFITTEIIGNLDIVKRLIAAGADVNKANNDNQTPLFIASQYGHLNIVEQLLAAGADKTILTKDGKLPIDVAKTEEIRKLLKDVPKNPIKWLGWSQGDASMLDGVFGDEATATNFALCPVCMKYVIRKDACMYMSHNCSEQRGYYHDMLYQKYKNSAGIINWCTVCGRICKGHNHFELSPAKGTVPPIMYGKDPFSKSCEKEGGGGVTEKLLRFRRLREHAKDLQDEVGKMDWWQAMDELCEEMWNAPMVKPERVLATMLETKKFNIPNTNFPLAIPEITNAPNIPYNGLMPIIHPEKTETIENAWMTDDFNLIQFRHRKADGTMNNHDGPSQQISREAFVGWLGNALGDPTAFSFGRCWQFKTTAQLAALNAAEKARMCDAVLHPEEVKAALDMEDEEQRKLAEGYHKAFNMAMDTRRTIRP
jgi:ankyrin repeat protein